MTTASNTAGAASFKRFMALPLGAAIALELLLKLPFMPGGAIPVASVVLGRDISPRSLWARPPHLQVHHRRHTH